jgi:hypothetical protein
MNAVAVRVSFNDVDAAEEMLQNEIVPMVKQAPGFVTGYWTRDADKTNGSSLMIFESEEAAQAVKERIESNEGPGGSDHVNLESIEVREVVANA